MPDAYPKVAFKFTSGESTVRVFGAMEEVSLTAGMLPDTCVLTAPIHEFTKLAGDWQAQGDLELYWSDPDTPDVTLVGWKIDHVEDSLSGWRPGDVGFSVVEKRLFIMDRRWEFLDMRGGAIWRGLVNASLPDGSGVKNSINGLTTSGETYKGAAVLLAAAMQYASGLAALSSTNIPDALHITDSKPRDLKWDGLHAPTELGRLLAEADAALFVKTDGTYKVEMIGTGTAPSLPSATLLPGDEMAQHDRRTEIVVISSAPQRQLIQETLGLATSSPPGWEYVGLETDGTYKSIAGGTLSWCASVAAGQTIIRDDFAGLSGAALACARTSLFRMVRLAEDSTHPAANYLPIATRLCEALTDASGEPRPAPFEVRAKIAQPVGGHWTNAATAIPVHGYKVRPADGVIEFDRPFGQVSPDNAAHLGKDFLAFTAGDDIAITFAHESRGESAGLTPWRDYWCAGFRRDGGGACEAMTPEDTDAALAGSSDDDVHVINCPELVAYVTPGEGPTDPPIVLNSDALVARALRIADRALKSTAPAKVYRYVGMQDVSPSGRIPRVTWNSRDGVTRFEYNGYHLSKSYYNDREASFQTARAARGAATAAGDAPRQLQHGGRDYALPRIEAPGGAPFLEGGGSNLSFAKVTAVKQPDNSAWTWTDFAAHGFPSHCEAHSCASDGSGVGSATIRILLNTVPPYPQVGVITAADNIIAYMPGDGVATVPGDGAHVLDGYVLPGVMGASFELFINAPSTYMVPSYDATGGHFNADWVRAHG